MHSELAHETPSAGTVDASPRLAGALVALPCWLLLVAAWTLTPHAGGFGTHTQLGLPGCSFLARTGYPCPSCGLTTSVAAAAHGRFGASLAAQPFGLVLFAAAGAYAAFGTGQAITGRQLWGRVRPGWWCVWAGLGGMLAGWAVRLGVGVATGELPLP